MRRRRPRVRGLTLPTFHPWMPPLTPPQDRSAPLRRAPSYLGFGRPAQNTAGQP